MGTTKVINSASTFLISKSQSYVLRPKDIFSAIDKLTNSKDFVIVTFGFYLDYYRNTLGVNQLSNDQYDGMKIFEFNGTPIVEHCLFILKKSDLPKFSFEEIPNEEIEKYDLKPVGEKYNIRAGVVDLNKASLPLREECIAERNETVEEIKTMALVDIHLIMKIEWNEAVEMIQIIEYSEYRQNGLANELSEIELFDAK